MLGSATGPLIRSSQSVEFRELLKKWSDQVRVIDCRERVNEGSCPVGALSTESYWTSDRIKSELSAQRATGRVFGASQGVRAQSADEHAGPLGKSVFCVLFQRQRFEQNTLGCSFLRRASCLRRVRQGKSEHRVQRELTGVSTSVGPVRDGAGHTESGGSLRDGCCGWRPPDSGAA